MRTCVRTRRWSSCRICVGSVMWASIQSSVPKSVRRDRRSALYASGVATNPVPPGPAGPPPTACRPPQTVEMATCQNNSVPQPVRPFQLRHAAGGRPRRPVPGWALRSCSKIRVAKYSFGLIQYSWRRGGMPETTVPRNTIRITCLCGEELLIGAELMGRVLRCPHCRRHLRPGLQFVLADESLAPNLTVQCSCGHFVVADVGASGKRVRCPVCNGHLIMPQPVVKFDSPGMLRVPRHVLERQLRKVQRKKQRASKEMTRLESAAHRGRISLGPGERICANLNCGALLRPRANVCPKCGTNRLTGRRYDGPGPAKDPEGKWEQV